MVLLKQHPAIARRPCESCREWMYDDGPDGDNQVVKRPDGSPEPRGFAPVPCDTQHGCPKGHYSKQKTHNHRNTLALIHFNAMRAARIPLTDPVMIRNASLLEEVERRLAQADHRELVTAAQISGLTIKPHG